MPLLVRLWLSLGRAFAPLVHYGARRLHIRQGIAKDRFAERLGRATQPRGQGRWIWIHAASLGEVRQTAKLVEDLQNTHGFRIVITTMTQSGAAWVAQSLPQAVHQFLPLDTPQAVRGFLDHWSPKMAIFVESDIWPRMVLTASDQGIPLVLLNARPSKSRERASQSFHFLLSRFAMITGKSQAVVGGLRALGLPDKCLHFFGDLRASVPALPVDHNTLSELQFAIGDRPVWIAASSHAEDEDHILTACKQVLDFDPRAILIWAPRHPQRAAPIMDAAGALNISRRSLSELITDHTQIYLVDTLGELGTMFSCGNIVFLGGSFGAQGGHNPFEPACFGAFILTGPNVRNHEAGFADLMAKGAAASVVDGEALAAQVIALMRSGEAEALGTKGRDLVTVVNEPVNKTSAAITAILSD